MHCRFQAFTLSSSPAMLGAMLGITHPLFHGHSYHSSHAASFNHWLTASPLCPLCQLSSILSDFRVTHATYPASGVPQILTDSSLSSTRLSLPGPKPEPLCVFIPSAYNLDSMVHHWDHFPAITPKYRSSLPLCRILPAKPSPGKTQLSAASAWHPKGRCGRDVALCYLISAEFTIISTGPSALCGDPTTCPVHHSHESEKLFPRSSVPSTFCTHSFSHFQLTTSLCVSLWEMELLRRKSHHFATIRLFSLSVSVPMGFCLLSDTAGLTALAPR